MKRMGGKPSTKKTSDHILTNKNPIILLKITNHQLKLNYQLKHFAVDEPGVTLKPECTFCIIGETEPISLESYKHLFLECKHSLQAPTPIA